MRRAEEDQATFLAARHDFHRMAQGGFGGGEKRLWRGQPAHGVRGYRAHADRRDTGNALAEAGQAVQRACAVFGIQRAVRAQARSHADRLAQAVDHAGLTVFHASHHHVVTVGAHVDGSDQFAVLDLDLIALTHAGARSGLQRVNSLMRGRGRVA